MRSSKGSMWWKWDLHVHTPMSIVQNYGGDTPETWERFFTDLEALPQEVKVIGINDYLFLDGYIRVKEAKASGRLANIDLVLPVVELRLDRFGGTNSNLKRVNFHAIFSDQLDPEIIQHQFLNLLQAEYRLSAESATVTWAAAPTRRSLTDLGQSIIDSVPTERRREFGAPLIEGFNALNFSVKSVAKALRSPYFRHKVLTAVGKTEWWSIQWNEQSIADKKDIINGVDFVFISAESPEHCNRAKKALADSGVNSRLLDCSDAHDYSTVETKDRIGNSFTWICADTEFDGLIQARKEPQHRIFLGEEPLNRFRVRTDPTNFIKSIKVSKRSGSNVIDPWFEGVNVELNPGLVAIIGNKGSGKSALSDIIGLLGNSPRLELASFLSKDRFRMRPENKADAFDGEMTWEGGPSVTRRLSDNAGASDVQRLTYVPQSLFEKLCNELTGTDRGEFDQELKNVIFSHVNAVDRMGYDSLDEMLQRETDQIEASIIQRRQELSQLNARIVAVEKQLTPQSREQLTAKLNHANDLLAAHDLTRPVEVPEPPSASGENAARLTSIEAATVRRDAAQASVETSRTRLGIINRDLTTLNRVAQRLDTLDRTYQAFLSDVAPDLTQLGLAATSLVQMTVDRAPLTELRRTLTEEATGLNEQLDAQRVGSYALIASTAEGEIQNLRTQLDEPNRRRREFLAALETWAAQRTILVGSDEHPDSVEHVRNRIARLEALPERLTELRNERVGITRAIHDDLKSIAAFYSRTYKPVQKFIEESEIARDRFKLEFAVSIEDKGFATSFLDLIHQGRSGSFSGRVEATQRISDILSAHSFDTADGAVALLDSVMDCLLRDHRSPDLPEMKLGDQLRAGKTEESLLDFMFGLSFLEPRYVLRMAGRNLSQLSPGEKGALILVFYLLVDQGSAPLIIDQPEENLDNQTVVELLVPSIKKAKAHRQIILVTHNPNLAVVCDAEQIVWAHKDPNGPVHIVYEAGAIENPLIRSKVIDVLEGTAPAFQNRKSKYLL